MPLGIDPRVDYACKMMLGNPAHPAVTIHFLNAVLRLEAPIVSVEILNPLMGKDRSEDKLVVLDVLARDSLGRLFNIEMQTRLPLSFPNRLLYYNCKNYTRQMHAADMEPETLAELLWDPPYREALGVLEMISKSPEDLQYYEDRLKFLRDEQGKLLAA